MFQKIYNNKIFLVGIAVVTYIVSLQLLTGDISFVGDDYYVLEFGHFYHFPKSALMRFLEFPRLVEAVYFTGIYEFFKLDPAGYTFLSFLLAGLASGIFALNIWYAFRDKQLSILSFCFSILLPHTIALPYLLHTDNSRLSAILFWAALLLIQIWFDNKKPICFWLSILIYSLSTSYESCFLLIFVAPFFVIGKFQRQNPENISFPYFDKLSQVLIGGVIVTGSTFAIKHVVDLLQYRLRFFGRIIGSQNTEYFSFLFLFVMIVLVTLIAKLFLGKREYRWLLLGINLGASLSMAYNMRIFLMKGGGVSINFKNSIITLKEIGVFFQYFIDPLRYINHFTFIEYFVSIAIFVLVAYMIIKEVFIPYKKKRYKIEGAFPRYLLVFIGILLLILGIIPYKLAGYEWGLGYRAHGRVFSGAIFGLALLLAWTTNKLSYSKHKWLVLLVCVYIGLMGGFQWYLRTGRVAAKAIQDTLIADINKIAPGVEDGTKFLLLNGQYYLNDIAVLEGVNGIQSQFAMMYDSQEVSAYFVYASDKVTNPELLATVSSEGIQTRGMSIPCPLNEILIFQRSRPSDGIYG